MSEQDATQASPLQRPPNDDTEAWKAYWKTQGQPWRTKPEIDAERQKHLAERRAITPDIDKGIYPFTGTKLNRADIEWLLATHEKGRGPVDWNDVSHRKRNGLDLRGADLSQEDLSGLPLACMRGGLALTEWHRATVEQRTIAAVRMQGANLGGGQLQGADLVQAQLQGAELGRAQLQEASLWRVQLQGADLARAQLQGADLTEAQLQEARLWRAQLQGADLHGAQLQGADLAEAQLQGAELTEAHLDGADLKEATLSDEKYGPVLLADIQWGEINLAVVDWGHVTRLGEEQKAHQKQDRRGEIKDKLTRIDEYKEAVRANRQLAIVLREQGLNEEADHFAYLAQKLQRVVWRRQRRFLQYAFSWFLAVVAGYGYKPYRCFVIYFLAVIGFTLAHYIVGAVAGPPLTFLNALAVSVQSLHGRLFSFQASDPQTLLNTIEAFVGLFIEAIVVAVITQRILGR
jgi:uncharacterized protein YjbI with pentapeptide repeats